MIELQDKIYLGSAIPSSGGGGGTSDYADLTNKPKINNVTLSGNKTSADLGLPSGRTLIANTTDTSSTIANIAGNTDYTFSQPLTALTITAVTANIMNEATLTFTASSSGCTVTLPASGLTQLGAPVTLGTANCQYTISFWNNFYIVGIVEP